MAKIEFLMKKNSQTRILMKKNGQNRMLDEEK